MRRLLVLLLLAAVLTLSARQGSDISYVFRRGEQSHFVSGNMPLGGISGITKRYQGDFLWARVGGKEYVIRDAATLDAAKRAFAEVDAFHARYHAIHEKMKPVERKHRQLENQMDELGDALGDDDDLTRGQRAEMEAKLARLEVAMAPIARELERLEAQEERLDEEMEPLEEAAERKLEEIILDAILRDLAGRL